MSDSELTKKKRKALLYGTILSIIGLAALYGLGYLVWDTVDLALNGKATIAQVVEYQPRTRSGRRGSRRTTHYHELIYDGHRGRLDLGQQVPRGTRLYIIYSTKDPRRLTVGKQDETALEILWHNKKLELLGAIFLAGVCLFTAFLHFKDIYTGDYPDLD